MKLINKLKHYNNILLIYNHGLGDVVNFIPLFKEIQKRIGKKKLTLSAPAKRQFNLIFPSMVNSDEEDVRKYDFIYKVAYPDAVNSYIPIEHGTESAKPYLCAKYEFGINDFVWKPHRILNKTFNKKSKRIGVHLFGHTGMKTKFCPNNISMLIWNEIIEAGYEPFEVHMILQFAYEYNQLDRDCDDCLPIINKKNSLRFEEPDLGKMIKEIGKCKYFIGIDSGPIYLASLLLGCENIIGLYNQKRHDHFLPKHINMVNVRSYKKGIIKRIIKNKNYEV